MCEALERAGSRKYILSIFSSLITLYDNVTKITKVGRSHI